MKSAPIRLACAAGNGLAAGLVLGLLSGGRLLFENRYLAHETYWLAADRMADGLFTWAIRGLFGGVVLHLVLAFLRGSRERKRTRAVWIVTAVFGALAFLATAGFRQALPALAASRAEGRPPVILVSIDTMRADRMGVMGYPLPVTPHLDRLAEEGVLFEQATANAPWTLPSHVSIFTSILPFDHGVRHAGQSIPGRFSLLAEHFRDGGYRTAAFTGGGYVSYGFGFDQGIETYRDHDEREEGGPGNIAAEALRWVRNVGEAPFFLFVHTYEPHFPYSNDRFADPADAGRIGPGYDPDELGLEDLTEEERRYATALYDSDVANADRVIGGMLETLREEGVLDRAILVVLSDHGEDCWDHDATNMPRHGHTLYQELLLVPLFIRAPGLIPPGTRIATPVSLLDVAPTVLDLAGLPPAPAHRGRSVAAACRGEGEPSQLPIHSESTRYGPERFSLREEILKVIVTPFPGDQQVRQVEAFDLQSDPFERSPLSDPASNLEQMTDTLRSRATEALHRPVDTETGADLTPELLEQLRSLGYVDEPK